MYHMKPIILPLPLTPWIVYISWCPLFGFFPLWFPLFYLVDVQEPTETDTQELNGISQAGISYVRWPLTELWFCSSTRLTECSWLCEKALSMEPTPVPMQGLIHLLRAPTERRSFSQHSLIRHDVQTWVLKTAFERIKHPLRDPKTQCKNTHILFYKKMFQL